MRPRGERDRVPLKRIGDCPRHLPGSLSFGVGGRGEGVCFPTEGGFLPVYIGGSSGSTARVALTDLGHII